MCCNSFYAERFLTCFFLLFGERRCNFDFSCGRVPVSYARVFLFCFAPILGPARICRLRSRSSRLLFDPISFVISRGQNSGKIEKYIKRYFINFFLISRQIKKNT